MTISVTKTTLESLAGTSITDARFAEVDAAARRLLRTGTTRDIDAQVGRAADILDAVYTSVALRLITNPTGARSLGLGSANVTFGGADGDISNPGSLTADERKDLAGLNRRRPTFARLRTIDPVIWEPLADPEPIITTTVTP